MRGCFISLLVLVALPAIAKPLVVCGSDTALEIQRQMGSRDMASDCWMDDSSKYRFGGERLSLMDDKTRVIDLIDRKGLTAVTNAKVWKR